MRLVLSLLCNAVALWVAALVVPGVTLQEATRIYAPETGVTLNQTTLSTMLALAVVAVVFSLVNAVVKPVVSLLSLPLTVLTLGLFLLVINAVMLMLTSWTTEQLHPFGAEYSVDGFGAAFQGGIVVGLVNWILGSILPRRSRER